MGRFPAGVANDVVGMGTWRLKGSCDPALELLLVRIEGSLRELLEDELTLCDPGAERWKAAGWDLLDSADPGRELGGWAWADVPDPQRGDPGFPRLVVENRAYASRAFRKLHLELAWRQDGLHVRRAEGVGGEGAICLARSARLFFSLRRFDQPPLFSLSSPVRP